jgi:hypothetical protein
MAEDSWKSWPGIWRLLEGLVKRMYHPGRLAILPPT